MNTGESGFWSSGSVPLIEPEFLSSIIAVASDIALVVSDKGIILSVLINAQNTGFGKLNHWEGRDIREFLTPDSVPKFNAISDHYRRGEPIQKSVELNHTDNATWDFPIRYSFHPFGKQNSILMLGRDLRPIAETQQQLVQAQMSLEQGYEARREFDARYRLLLRSVSDPIVFVAVKDGSIKDLNEPAAGLLGSTREDLIGKPFAGEFRDRRTDEMVESLVNSALAESASGLSVNSRKNRQNLQILSSVFRVAGERLLLCKLNRPTEAGVQPDELSHDLTMLFEKGSDAIVFTSSAGQINACNDAFLDLVDAPHLVDVKGRNLADYLGRGQVDLSVLVENARRNGQMRMYSTKVQNDLGAKVTVEMSVTYLNNRPDPILAFVIRDTSRSDALRRAPTGGSEDSNRNVMELVGSAPLKEIVAETTDVVERMCIETAVNLTRNNRVAAAEMLGLSRQSLYVKLRKYGLLTKDDSDDS